MSTDRRQDRNREELRNQADTEPHETQDIRPEYERSRAEDERAEEQEDVARTRKPRETKG